MFITGAKTKVMAGSKRKEDVLFAVSALSDGLFDNDEDIRTYSETIRDYFAHSDTVAETDTECGMHNLTL